MKLFNRNPGCPLRGDAVAFVQGGLSGPEAQAFAQHAESCPACGRECREIRGVIGLLKQERPEREPARDLVGSVMQRLRDEPEAARRRRWPAWVAAAALVAALLGGALWGRTDPRRPALDEAAQWLADTQKADGSWGASSKSEAAYAPALTGLGLLAGLELGGNAKAAPVGARAAAWLVQDQGEGGQFGRPFAGSPYNQGISTLALLGWCEKRPDEAGCRQAAAKAVDCILRTQGPAGGWGYAEGDPEANVSITIWQLQALWKARELGFDRDEAVHSGIQRGLRWLRTTRNGEGQYGYRRPGDYPAGSAALTAMSVFCEMDCDAGAARRPDVKRSVREVLREAAAGADPPSYYAAFFITRVLQRAGGAEMETRLVQVQRALLARQVRAGRDRGSWDLRDAYADVGGRVYATSMAVLALKD